MRWNLLTLDGFSIKNDLFLLSVAWSVCLSSVCHIRAPCLNRSKDEDDIGHTDTRVGSSDHCVRWGFLITSGEGIFGE